MYLELFSNELFLDLFEYLSTVHLLQAFYHLNIRFNDLLFRHLKNHSLDFQSSSKKNFTVVCQRYIPSIINRITSLRLSDDDQTPNQIDLFFSYGLSFQQFPNLQSLSINQIYSTNSLKLIINELTHLPQLIRFTATRYLILFNEEYDIAMLHAIGRLPKLIHCHLDVTNDSEYAASRPSIRSASLKFLSLPYLDCTIDRCFSLIQRIPNLQSLTAYISDSSEVLRTSVIRFASIKIFKVDFHGSFSAMRNLFKAIPNLEELTIDMNSTYIDGYRWENLIETNLPHLIRFQFRMLFSLSYERTADEQIDEILNSFRHQFWTEKHRWFVQCYWTRLEISPTTYVYTLPYTFRNLQYSSQGQLKSTDSNNDVSFAQVHNLYYDDYSSDHSSISPLQFDNLRYLYLTIPFSDSLQRTIAKFDRLEALKLVLCSDINDTDHVKLQLLFNQLTRLRSLTFFSWSTQYVFPFELENSSIRKLDLRGPNIFYNHQQCQQLYRSSIGQQCEILFINIEERIDLLDLINQLVNLHALIVKWSRFKTNESLIKWLEQHSLSTPILLNSEEIRLWIR